MTSVSPIIAFQDVSKSYGLCKANDQLNFEIQAGTIHALVGENGAGKSTAMRMLFGMERPTSGRISVKGQICNFLSPRDAQATGIGMVHQHFMLSADHTALENILLGLNTPGRPAWRRMIPRILRPLGRVKVAQELDALSKEVGFQIPWAERVASLPVGIQQQLEILKLLYAGVEIMIFDEPTAVLSPPETQSFLQMIETLKKQGKTIVLITHKLREVLAVSDFVTVMRAGKSVVTKSAGGCSIQELADLMVGRHVKLAQSGERPTRRGDIRIKVEDLSLGSGSRPILSDISFDVHAGEILGVAGVQGNGQEDLIGFLYDPKLSSDLHKKFKGRLRILDHDTNGFRATDMRRLKIGIIAADRHEESVLLSESLAENNALGYLDDAAYGPWLSRRVLKMHTEHMIRQFDVRPQNADLEMSSLSGGNQQKFVVARELSRKPAVLLCSEPTRGVDVGSIEQIHRALLTARSEGTATLLVSSQLDELFELSDRIIVMSGGRIAAMFSRSEFDESRVGRAMMGGAV